MAEDFSSQGPSISPTSTDAGYISIMGSSHYISDSVDAIVKKKGKGISPILYFKYIKKKFGILERIRLDSRLKKLEKAFYKAIENGQEALGEKIIRWIAKETKESVLYSKGIRLFIEREDLDKYKHKIRDGYISDTPFKEFTRVIPKAVLIKKKKLEKFFDGFVIYHYWKEDQDTKEMDAEEKAQMKDPVLFGFIKETSRLYFITDWEDEHCDLTFDEMIEVVGKDDEEFTLSNKPEALEE
jgi:hypothetical protein